ncbi:MAG: hypothetical protein ACTHLT_00630 [Devosia sp.]
MSHPYPTFYQQSLADQSWFKANPDRSFRVRVTSNAELAALLGSRDGFGSPIFPIGDAVVVTYWRFDSPTTKAMDHLTIASAPKWLLAGAANVGSDELALELLVRSRVPLPDVVFVCPAPLILTDSAA